MKTGMIINGGLTMKIVGKSFAALAAALLAFSSCNRVALPEIPAESHSISFVAKAPQTKTSATIDKDAKTVDYSWSEKDTERFTIYEIVGETYTAATSVSAILDDGTMMLEAEFGGTATPGAKYVALLNGGVQANQEASDTEYDQASDVLVSEVVTSESIEDEVLLLSFKRETAFALMTAKNLEGEYVLGASVSADKNLAAEYDYKAGTFKEDGCKTVTVSDRDDDGNYDVISEIQGGQSTLFLATVPVDEASLTVGVVTADENGDFKAAYEKSFGTGKSISFTRGDVHAFGIGMNKVESLTLDLSKDETTTASAEELSWDRTFVSVVSAKVSGTDADNYHPGKGNTSTRFYKGNTLTFTQKLGVPVKEIIYTAATEGYATALKNSEWSNAIASVSGQIVTIIPTDGTKAVSALISATTGATEIVITYGIPVQPTPHSITIDAAIEHGSVTATPSSDIMPGTEVTLAATPDDGYEFGSWNVTNAFTGDEIAIADNKFTMPAADVNVSATFKKQEAGNSETYTFESFTSAQDVTFIAEDFTIVFHKGTGSNNPAWASNQARVYANGYVVVSSSTKNIVKVEYDYIINANKSGVSPTIDSVEGTTDEGTWNAGSKTWTGSDTDVTLYTSGSAGNLGFTSITVYFDDTPIPTKYDVTVANGITNGTVAVDLSKAAAGQIVTITATPASGYKVKSVSAKTASENALTVTNNKFTMPAEAVTVSAEFEEDGGSKTKDYSPKYTLTPIAGSNNSYTGNCDVDVQGITWNVSGNAQQLPWRLGGKSITDVDRAVYSKTAYAKDLWKVSLTVGSASSITVNSLKLVYSTKADFSDEKEVSGTFAESSTIDFEEDFPANCYYKFVFNLTVSGSSNKFVQFSKVEFFGYNEN